jgi:hypothetical protein
MAISVDVVISGKTETSVEGKTSTAVVTTNLQEDKLGTKGGIISGSILPHQTDTVDLGSPSKRFLNLYAKTAHLAADSLKLGDEATISAGPGGGFSFDTDGETIFGDIKVRNLTVTGTQSVISSTDLAVKDNIIIINSGEAGAGITLTSGGLVVDRGTLENATILFNDNTDRFELNFPIAVDGSELALAPNLVVTGQTLQGQITTNDTDIANLTTNLQSTGSTVAANLITTGQTLTTNLASTGSYLTTEVNTLSGLSVFHSMTGNFATHIKDLDDVTLAGNQGKYLKVNSAGDGISYDIPPVTGVGGEGGGAVKFTGLVDAPNDYSSLQTEFPANGGLVAVNSASESLVYLNSGVFATDHDLITTGNTLNSQRDALSGDLISTGNALDAARDTLSGNLISTGNNLQSQITSNDSDIASINTNLVSTGNKLDSLRDILSGNLISSGNNLESQIINNDADISTLSGNLITTGTTLGNTIISTGNHLDSLRDTLSGNLISSGNTLDDKRDTLSGNLITTGQNLENDIDTLSGNLISTGNNLQSQITNNDTDISALQLATGEIQNVKFNKTGGTISGEILPNTSGTINLGSPSLPFRSGHFDDLIVSSDSIKIGSEATLSSPPEGGIKFDTTGTIAFGDVSIKNLTVTGTRTIVETTDTAIKDNIILLNSGEDGAGITLSSGGLVIDRGSSTDANILFNDSTDHFEVNFPLAIEGSLAVKQNQTGVFAEAANLVTTGQTLQAQITSNDTDISTLTSNLTSTGNTLDAKIDTLSGVVTLDSETGSLIDTSMTGDFAVNFLDLDDTPGSLGAVGQSVVVNAARDGLIFSGVSAGGGGSSTFVGLSDTPGALTASRLLAVNSAGNAVEFLESGNLVTDAETGVFATSANLVTTGQTLTTNINSVSSNLVSTGNVVDDVSGNLITTGQTLQTQITTLQGPTGDYLTEESASGTYSTQFNVTAAGGAYSLSEITAGSHTTTSQVQKLEINLQRGNTYKFTTDSSTNGHPFIFVTQGNGGAYTHEYTSGITNSRAQNGGILYFRVPQSAPSSLTYACGVHGNMGANVKIYDDTGNLIDNSVTGQFASDADITTLTSNLITTGQTLTSEIAVVSGIAIGGSAQDFNELSGNLITTGQTLQTQITSNDGDITTLTSNLVTTGQTLTTSINTVSTNLVSTGKVTDDVSGNLITTGQTLQTQITSNDSDISTLTSNLGTTGQTLTSEISTLSGLATLDSETGSLIDTSMTGDFADTTILESFAQGLNVGTSSNLANRKLHVVGDVEISGTIFQSGSVFEGGGGGGGGGSSTFVGLSDTPGSFTANKYVRVNSAGNALEFTETVGGINSTDIFTGDGSVSGFLLTPAAVTSTKDLLVSLNGILQRPDTDYSIVGNTGLFFNTSVTSGYFVEARHIVGVSGAAGADGSAGDLTASGFITTGNTGQFASDADVSSVSSNLVSTGSIVDDISGNLITTGSVVDDISGNLITTGQTLQTQITSNDSDISTLTSNLITTGQTLTSEISTLSGLATLDSETGNLIDTSMTGDFANTTILESFAQGLNVGTSSNLTDRKLHVVGDIEISGTIYQSGSVFEGGGGGGGGSSTFVGLSDTPGSFTANKYLSVNSAGNAIEMVDTIQSGYQSVDQGYFTGLTLGGTGTGILQNASGTISNLDLADNKFDVSVIEERDSSVGDAFLSSVELQCTYETNINDESDNAVTATAAGSAARSTSQAKEGSASLDTNGDYVTFPYSADYTAMSSDWTIEAWMYYQNDAGFMCSAGNGHNGWWFQVDGSFIRFQTYGTPAVIATETITLSNNTWYHMAAVRNGNDLKVYVNGTSSHASVTLSAALPNGGNRPLHIGTYSAAGQEHLNRLDAFIDLFRITTAARYTSNFTPPTSFQGNITENKYIGQIGGIDDSDVDYGIEKLSNSQLMIKKLSSNDFTPDRLYVNVNKLGALGKGIAFNEFYTGDGTTTNFAIPSAVDNVRDVLVSVEGLVQIPATDYTLAGTTGVSFTTAVTSGHLVDIRHLALGPSGAAGAAGADGSVGDLTASGFITTGNTGQFASDADVSSVSSNLVSTGSVVDDISGNLITTGQTLQTQITSNDSDISTLTSNLITTGQTLTTNINTVSSNLVSTGAVVDDISGNLITTGQTLQTQITSNDGDITTLTSNLVTTGQTLQTQITSNDSDITTLTSNLITTGQTLTSEISTLSGLATLDSETGSLIDTSMTGDFADTTILESFTQGLNVGTSNNLASRKLHVVGDVEISGTIYQSGSVFEGGGGGGGGGSSTFVGLSDTPGSFTANKVLTVNSAGNAVETTFNTSVLSGHQSVEQGYFTGLTLGGTGTGILQNSSGTISNLDLADNKFDVSVIEERDTVVGDANFSDVSLLLPFDGSNGATSTSDSSDSGRTITLNSSVVLSTTQSKFGGTSLYVPGSSNACQIGGSFSFAGDFTIEFWEYIDTRYNDSISIGFNASSTNYVWHSILYGYYNGGTKIKLYSSSNGSSWNIANAVEVGDKLDDQWVHRALVRSGSTWYSFQNGTLYWTADLGSSALNTASQYHWLGRGYNSTSNRTNEGYYDDVRVTLGVARYTSSFTAPSAAFPTSENITAAKYIGQIGGIDDSDVDYGIEKLSNSQLMIKKLSDNTFTPDRLYVNVTQLGALGQGIAFDQVYTGDGTTTNYLLSENVSNARDVLVSVEGLIQTPIIDYTLAGTTGVSFTAGVVSGHEISFRHLALGPSGATGPAGAAGASADISYLTERFTGDGVVSGFGMSRSISTADEIFVFVNGLVQDSGANFSVTAATGLYFTSGEIASGDKIMVRHIY